ncbi:MULTISPECIES: cytochrome c [unclassified Wenzhouxiangella]|uniref:c-type cytochrome n=1 Tax=unclassified Wenzhouxiangella TaxID=2613841 RepID=UPI000E32BE08|nr:MULTISPECIES: cytochrome c [unclassified Wenzhouxiangella]RFF27920.1 cytochrome c [Wenzhouxiangella sp. 15181]RFP67203.1 cytochrome c [Wenzhouxiangella sp. 15190]
MKTIGRFIRTVLILVVIVVGAAIAYAYSGHYDISVGTGHTPWTAWYLGTLRERAIETRAGDIDVPDLDDSDMAEAGAVAYDESCSGCHGRPGRSPSDSFDPRPPALTRGQPDPAEMYWVARNGIKMSAMPRIGEERVSDEQLWQIAAFLQTASSLTEGEYRNLVEPPEPEPEQEPEATEEESETGEPSTDDERAADSGDSAEDEDGSDEAENGNNGSGGEGETA